MDLSSWFHDQLKASGAGFIWAMEQIPVERRYLPPPRHPEDWPAARHLFHMLYYEREMVLPNMRCWLSKDEPTWSLEPGDEEAAWEEHGRTQAFEEMLAEFRVVRDEQIALLPSFDDALWHESREVLWGSVPLRWVVTKTYQHTCEHTHDVLRMVLFWEPRPAPPEDQEANL